MRKKFSDSSDSNFRGHLHTFEIESDGDEIVNFTLAKGFEKKRRLKAYTFGSIEPILLRHKELGGFDLKKAHRYLEEEARAEQERTLFQGNSTISKLFRVLMESIFFSKKKHIAKSNPQRITE